MRAGNFGDLFVVVVSRRDRGNFCVDDLEDLARDYVHLDSEAFDGAAPGVEGPVGFGAGTEADALGGLLRRAAVGDGESEALDGAEVGDASLLEGFDDAWVLLDGAVGTDEFAQAEGGLGVFEFLARGDRFVCDVYGCGEGLVAFAEDDVGLTGDGLVGEDGLFGRGMEEDAGECSVCVGLAGFLESFIYGPEFGGGETV